MTSEIRANKQTNRVGLGTVEYTDTGIIVSGIVTCTELSGLTALNIAGVGTASTLDINGDIDVDGHTNLDNVSIAGVTTTSTVNFATNARANFASNNRLSIHSNGTNSYLDYGGSLNVRGSSGSAAALSFLSDSNVLVSNSLSINDDLDVDGHTNLDNVSIAGVATATTFVGALTGTASGNPTMSSGANDRVMTATGTNALKGEPALTFDGATLNIDGGTNDTPLIIDTSNVSGSHMRFRKDGSNKHFLGCGGGFGLGDVDDLSLRTVDNIIFGVGTSEKLRIESGGGLKFTGQGTSIPVGGILHHTNNNLYVRGGTNGLILGNQDNTNTVQIYNGYIKFETNDGSEKLRITSNGSVNIGNSTQTTHLLYLTSTGDAGIHLRADSDNADETHNAYISMAQDGANTQQFKLGMAGDANTEFNMSLANSPFVHANNGNSQPLQLAHMSDMIVTISSVATLGGTGTSATDPKDFDTNGSLSGNAVGGLKIHHYGNDTAAALRLAGHNNTGTPGGETGTQLTHTGANLRFHIEHNGYEAFNIGPTGNIYLKNCSTIPSFTTSYNVSAISLKGGGLMNYQENNMYLLCNMHYDGAWRNTYTGSGGYIALGSGALNHYYYADQSSANQSLSLIRNVSFYKNNSAGTGLNQGNRSSVQGQIVIWGHSNATTAGGIEFHTSGGGGAGYGGRMTCDTDGSVSIHTRNNNSAWTQRLRLGNGNNVTVHNSEFQVNNNELQVTSSNSYACHFNYQDNGSNYISFAQNGSTTFRNNVGGGNVMIVYGSGNIGAPSGNNIYNASDERLKENMVELTDGLDKIKKLKPYSFNWKKGFDKDLEGVTQYGFGAHQAKSVDEKLVEKFSENDIELDGETIKDPLRVNEKHVIPLLVKAIQEQQEQIETLKSEIAALKG
jgi:hypothetical protein